jgi:hypothetical protein
MSNLNTWDRLIRALFGLVALELAFFWLGGGLQMAAYGVAAVLLVTALVRFCPLYKLLGISSSNHETEGGDKQFGKSMGALALLLLLAVLAGGSYASIFFTRKLFLEDFNVMNNFYKQTLFLTGKNEREKALANYERLVPEFQQFAKKYASYQPYALRGDTQLAPDLAQVSGMLSGVNNTIRSGDLHEAHLALEKVRPVFQDIFKRNGFSMLAVALVDFHDDMELMLDAANAKNAALVIALYPRVNEKLQGIEAQTNDAAIQAIRNNLDALLALAETAQADQLPAKGEALRSSFIKVYLQRG